MEAKKAAFVVIAEFEVPSTVRSEFLELGRFDSARSVADEAGCLQFDVMVSNEEPEKVVFYEVYEDRAAFDVHLTTPHYAAFAAGLERLGEVSKQVRFFTRQHP